jgi:hypothetical protein
MAAAQGGHVELVKRLLAVGGLFLRLYLKSVRWYIVVPLDIAACFYSWTLAVRTIMYSELPSTMLLQ